MAFDQTTRGRVDSYAREDLGGDLDSHVEFFSFLSDDTDLMRRVGEEYFSARYLYKLWEGLRIDEQWARRAQVQLQVQQYASIYEACLHHLLFVRCDGTPEVNALTSLRTLRPWDVSSSLREQLVRAPGPPNRPVVAAIHTAITVDETKVRFEHKADAAVSLGIIDKSLAEELKEFYSARNMIHIHAEIKKGAEWSWELEFARHAYWRLQAFRRQIVDWEKRMAAADDAHAHG
jgi:hypothetical protein